MGLISFVIFLIALIPFLGWINWYNIPFAFVILVLSVIALFVDKDGKGKAIVTLLLSSVIIFLGIIRLILGLGIF